MKSKKYFIKKISSEADGISSRDTLDEAISLANRIKGYVFILNESEDESDIIYRYSDQEKKKSTLDK